MYDLSRLSSTQFEQISRDILEKKLKQKFYIFPPGKDGGIDSINDNDNNIIVLQAKRYSNSSFSNLLVSFKKEVEKMKLIKPNEYYFFVAKELTKSNRDTLIRESNGLLKGYNNIYTKNEINDFLIKPENKDVRNNYPILWIESAETLKDIINSKHVLDSSELIKDIMSMKNKFLPTKSFHHALDILSENNVLIITGNPGVGKTTISKFLALDYLSKDYDIKYLSSGDIDGYKSNITYSSTNKELIYIDDFLGEHFADLIKGIANQLKTLISYVLGSENRKLIMNSRISIFNDTKSKFYSFKSLVENEYIKNIVLDINELSLSEKALIFINHIKDEKIEEKYINNILENKSYIKIIKHSNYNPRIIEHVTRKRYYSEIEANNYTNEIIKTLTFPNEIWHDEFTNRLDLEDRIFMNTLYSFGRNDINKEVLKKAFNNRINKLNMDTTLNHFNIVYERLNKSLLKTIYNEKTKTTTISALNPSINDYLMGSIIDSTNEQQSIIKHAVYVDQIKTLINLNKDNIKYINLEMFNKYEVFKENKSLVYIDLAIKKNELNESIKEQVVFHFKNVMNSSSYGKNSLLEDLIDSKIFKFYDLDNILFQNFHKYLNSLYMYSIESIVNYYITNNFEIKDEHVGYIKEAILDTLKEEIPEEINMNVDKLVGKIYDEFYLELINSFHNYSIDDFKDEWFYQINEYIEEEIEHYKDMKLKSFPIDIEFSSYETNDIKYYINDDEVMDSLIDVLKDDSMSNDKDDFDYEDDEEHNIERMFENLRNKQ